jgi:hypothetical protein
VASICTPEEAAASEAVAWSASLVPQVDPAPLVGAGLPRPAPISSAAPAMSVRQPFGI